MAIQPNAELLEIKTLISNRFNQLDRKLDETKAELTQNIIETKSELKQDISDLKGDIKALHVEVKGLEKRLSNVETSTAKIPEITEKFGELKNWRQTAFIIIAGVVSAFLGWIARGNKI
jgi:predicted nuclease with TOPRIM domain